MNGYLRIKESKYFGVVVLMVVVGGDVTATGRTRILIVATAEFFCGVSRSIAYNLKEKTTIQHLNKTTALGHPA
jgi:hypothetical protein